MRDVAHLLKTDHQQLKALLARLVETGPGAARTREKLREQVETLIQAHTRIEEEIFYPAARSATTGDAEEQLLIEACEEHGLMDSMLPRLSTDDTPSNEFAARAKVIKGLIERHAEEKERGLFPAARAALDAEHLAERCDTAETRREELLGERARR